MRLVPVSIRPSDVPRPRGEGTQCSEGAPGLKGRPVPSAVPLLALSTCVPRALTVHLPVHCLRGPRGRPVTVPGGHSQRAEFPLIHLC